MKMPTLFIGHGSPMNAIEKNSFTDFLNHCSNLFPRPQVILSISAHWETMGTKVLKTELPRTIHDFGGFPEALYQINYPAKGSLMMADRIVDLMQQYNVASDSTWGLDHGTWSVLKHIFPLANIPVLQLSLNRALTLEQHLEIARGLRPLRNEGVLILGSGNIVHNLRRIVADVSAPAMLWATEFDLMIKNALINKNEKLLVQMNSENQALWDISHPSLEHYIPLLYAYGASDQADKVQFIFEGMMHGSLSMRSILFGA